MASRSQDSANRGRIAHATCSTALQSKRHRHSAQKRRVDSQPVLDLWPERVPLVLEDRVGHECLAKRARCDRETCTGMLPTRMVAGFASAAFCAATRFCHHSASSTICSASSGSWLMISQIQGAQRRFQTGRHAFLGDCRRHAPARRQPALIQCHRATIAVQTGYFTRVSSPSAAVLTARQQPGGAISSP